MSLPPDSNRLDINTSAAVVLEVVKRNYHQHNKLRVTADEHNKNIKNCVRALIVNQNSKKDEDTEIYLKSSLLISLGHIEQIVKTGIEMVNNSTPVHKGYILYDKLDDDLVLNDALKEKIRNNMEKISSFSDCGAIILGNKYLGEIQAVRLILEGIIKTYESKV
jgi:hypothetical protein